MTDTEQIECEVLVSLEIFDDEIISESRASM